MPSSPATCSASARSPSTVPGGAAAPGIQGFPGFTPGTAPDLAARILAERFAEVDGDNRWLGQPRNLRIPMQGFRCLWHALRGEAAPFVALGEEVLADVDSDPQRRSTWRGQASKGSPAT